MCRAYGDAGQAFGTGVIGDWTCHVVDPVFWTLALGAPSHIEALEH